MCKPNSVNRIHLSIKIHARVAYPDYRLRKYALIKRRMCVLNIDLTAQICYTLAPGSQESRDELISKEYCNHMQIRHG